MRVIWQRDFQRVAKPQSVYGFKTSVIWGPVYKAMHHVTAWLWSCKWLPNFEKTLGCSGIQMTLRHSHRLWGECKHSPTQTACQLLSWYKSKQPFFRWREQRWFISTESYWISLEQHWPKSLRPRPSGRAECLVPAAGTELSIQALPWNSV